MVTADFKFKDGNFMMGNIAGWFILKSITAINTI